MYANSDGRLGPFRRARKVVWPRETTLSFTLRCIMSDKARFSYSYTTMYCVTIHVLHGEAWSRVWSSNLVGVFMTTVAIRHILIRSKTLEYTHTCLADDNVE